MVQSHFQNESLRTREVDGVNFSPRIRSILQLKSPGRKRKMNSFFLHLFCYIQAFIG
jgi:hypothetical protein